MTLREILGRLAAWRQKDALDRELTHELREHLELLQRDLEQEGMAPDDARAAARRQLGNLTSLKESSRDAWGFPAVERMLQDFRYALRGLGRSPGFTAAAVITLALGIGANAAMFAVIDRVMFRPFPLMRDPGSVNRVYIQTTYQGRTLANPVFPYTRFLDLKRETSLFSDYAALTEWRFAVGSGDETTVRKVAGVSASFFGFFDAPPVRGRYFVATEDSIPIGAMVAVLSHALWRNTFDGGDVVGRILKVGSLDYTIIGVAPEAFVGTVIGAQPAVFVPITTIPMNLGPSSLAGYSTEYRWDWTEMLVRRKPGVSEAMATTELTGAYIRSRAAARAINPRVLPDSVVQPRGIAGAVKLAAGPDRGGEARVLLWVSGVAAIVLLIACASVANLMVARVIRRRREVTIRLALGVTRARLLAQFVVESLLLSLAGVVAGLFVAQWSGPAIRRLLLPEGSSFDLTEDWRTLTFAIGAALVCTLLTAVGPMLVARRGDLAAMLKGGAREGGHHRNRLQSTLLVLQVSLSVVLLVGAGLFVRSFTEARSLPLGYDAGPVIELRTDFRGQAMTPAERIAIQQRLVAAARAIPGVEAVAEFNSRIFSTNTARLAVPGIDSVEALGRFNFQLSSPEYFAVMRISILRGRGLEASDRAGAPSVAVVSEAMANALWPGRDPLGQCLRVAFGPDPNVDGATCTTVVGIAQNTMQQDLAEDPMYAYYLAKDQFFPGMLAPLLLRMATPDPLPHLERVRVEMTRAMPGDGFVFVWPLQEIVDDQTSTWRLGATLFVAFGTLALVVAIVGLYGVISYGVAGRMHELGVRAALGARPGNILRLVVARAVRFALAGVVIGVVVALIAARWVEPLLFKLSARDPWTYGGVAIAMLVVAVAASLIPAMRAVRADPMTALRAD